MVGIGPVDLAEFKPRFDALKQPRDFVGEDYAFSNRLREMGVDLFIYPNATISHFGVNAWTGNFDTYLREREKEKMQPMKKEQGVH